VGQASRLYGAAAASLSLKRKGEVAFEFFDEDAALRPTCQPVETN